MARTIYSNYSKFTNVNGGADVLAKLRTFALSVGWSSRYYHVDHVWQAVDPPTNPATYEFAPGGTQKHLELNSNGYGLQNLNFRFMCDNHDGQSDHLRMAAIKPAYAAVDTFFSTSPYAANYFNYSNYTWMSLPSSSFPEMCLIGNDKVISGHLRVNSALTLNFAFGSYELLPAEQAVETEMQTYWNSQYYNYDWYLKTSQSVYPNYFFGPFYLENRNTWVDGQSNDTTKIHATLRFDENDLPYQYWFNRSDLGAANAFSGLRTLVSVPVMRKDATTSVWRIIGHLPIYYIAYGGLSWGEIIQRGSESYMVFPNMWTTQKFGTAYRVA